MVNSLSEAWELADWVRLTVHFPLFMLCDNALACIFYRCTMFVVSLHRGKEFVEFCLTVTTLIGNPIDLSCHSYRLNPTCVVIVLDARRAMDQLSSNYIQKSGEFDFIDPRTSALEPSRDPFGSYGRCCHCWAVDIGGSESVTRDVSPEG